MYFEWLCFFWDMVSLWSLVKPWTLDPPAKDKFTGIHTTTGSAGFRLQKYFIQRTKGNQERKVTGAGPRGRSHPPGLPSSPGLQAPPHPEASWPASGPSSVETRILSFYLNFNFLNFTFTKTVSLATYNDWELGRLPDIKTNFRGSEIRNTEAALLS